MIESAIHSAHGLSVTDLEVRYAGVPAVEEVAFDVAPGELFMLVGPSGCGKSSVLRAVAGLVRPTRGRVVLDGDIVTDTASELYLPPQQRHVGLVFQSYALWPT